MVFFPGRDGVSYACQVDGRGQAIESVVMFGNHLA